MSPDQEWELIRLYGTTDLSLGEIAKRFGVSGTYPYRIFEKNNITWRRGNELTFDQWVKQNMPELLDSDESIDLTDEESEAELQEPVTIDYAASEYAINLDKQFELVDVNQSEFLVELVEHLVVASVSMEGALAKARQMRPEARIRSVRENII